MTPLASPLYSDLQTTEVPDASRLARAKRVDALGPGGEFEAILLGKLLNELQETFSVQESGDEADGTSGQFRGFASEALGREFARAGGIGLARMIEKEDFAGTAKVPEKPADIQKV